MAQPDRAVTREMVSAARLLWELNAADNLPTDPEVQRVAGLEVTGKDVAALSLGAGSTQSRVRTDTPSERSNRPHQYHRRQMTSSAAESWNWTGWNHVVRSTQIWLLMIFAGFMISVFIMAFAVELGAGFHRSAKVGAWFWGIVSTLWTVLAILMRRKLAQRWDRPLEVFPFHSVRQSRRLRRNRGLRRGLQPGLVVLAWIAGGFLVIALLATPLYVESIESGGTPPPQVLVIGSRTLFIFMLFLLGMALLVAGPIFARQGRAEYDAAERRQRELLKELPNSQLVETARLSNLEDFLSNVNDEKWNEAFQAFEEFRKASGRDSILSQTLFAFIGAVFGTALAFLLLLIE